MREKLRRAEASKYLADAHGVQCAVSTLAKLASSGGGPLYCRIGPYPFYATEDLDRWVEANTSKRMQRASEVRAKSLSRPPQPETADRPRPGRRKGSPTTPAPAEL
jgi:hypothetical protein